MTTRPEPDDTPIAAHPIGRVESPLTARADAPRQDDEGAPAATLVIDPALRPALAGVRPGDALVVVTWLHQADRGVLTVHPRGDLARPETGVFATRSPDRPNPIGLHEVTITAVDGCTLAVTGLDAIDGTPILDLKPRLGPVAGR